MKSLLLFHYEIFVKKESVILLKQGFNPNITTMKTPISDISLPTNLFITQQSFFTKRFFSPCNGKETIRKCLFICLVNLFLCLPALADYTVASGSTINASTITGQSGVLTINGTLLLNSNQTLSGFTSVIINGPNGQIFWGNNADLTFATGTTIVINNPALGLQPTTGGGNSSQRLYIGTTLISVSSDNSNAPTFSFEQLNSLGGLPQFNLAFNSSVCAGGPVSLKNTPDKTSSTVTFKYDWSIATSSANFSPGSSNSSTTYDSVSISPAVGTYTISCSVSSNGKTLDTKSVTVTVSSIPAAPTPVSATPTNICSGSSSNLTATSSGNTIYWYPAASGGISVGTSGSAVNFSVAPIGTTTYYAEAQSAAGCKSTSRGSATITVNPLPTATISGTTTVCQNAASPNISFTGAAGTAPYTFTYTINSGANQTVSATSGNSVTITAPTGAAGSFVYTLVSVQDAGSTSCSNPQTGTATITVNALPTATLSGTATVCKNNTSPNISFTGAAGTAPYTFTYKINSGANQTITTTSGNTATIAAPITTAGTFVYTLISVQDASSTSCSNTQTGSATVTVNDPVTITTQPATNSFCLGSNPSISVAATGTSVTYQWQLSTTGSSGSFTNISADATFSGVTAATLNIANPAVSLSSNFYRVVVAGACGAVNSNTVALKYSNVWMGNNSTDWNTSGNWSDGNLPSTACTNVYIPKRTNQPTLNSTPVPTITNLVIDSGAVLTLTNATLNIAGCITNNGSFDATNGSVNFIGNTMQTIAGSSLAANTIKELIVSNTAGITIAASANDSLNITGKLSFGSVNNAAINTNDNLVLVSNAAGTARVADITNSGANSGNKFVGKVSVQRYFPARRSWRLFTAPLAKAGSIFDYLQNGGNYAAGKGTYVSGANPSTANGLDLSPFNNTSLKEGSNLTPVTNTKTAMLSKNSADTSDNKAYFIFVRGDRTAINFNPPYSDITTLNSKGNLQTGRQTFSASSSLNAFTLIGNPYASPVDFRKLTRNNILNRVYVWDPYLNSEQGGYITLDDVNNTGTYDIHPQSPGGLNQIIQSGQAFFVQTATANPASLVFQENAKADTAANRTAFRSMNFMPALQIELYQLNTDNSKVLADGTFAQFDKSFDKRVTFQDALKFGNVKEMLSLQRDNKNMIIERRPLIQNNDTLFLQLTKTTQRNYRLQFDPENMDPGITAFLEDSYTGTQTPVSTLAASGYNFVINADTASAAANRFKIIFKQINSIALPVTYSRINAHQQASNIAVEWTVENEVNISKYEVEKSTDAISFSTVNTTVAVGANRSSTDYKWLDIHPVNGNNYYRVRSVSPDGKYEYSKVVLVKIANATSGIRIYPNPVNGNNYYGVRSVSPDGKYEYSKVVLEKITNAASGIRIYPNPVTDGIITAEFKNMPGGIYKTRLLNAVGQIVLTKVINHTMETLMENIIPDFKLIAGIYQLEITTSGNTITSVKVIVQ
jgi:hypothetical protein